jgi:hypothetical protein
VLTGQHHAAYLGRRQYTLQHAGAAALPHVDFRHAEHRRVSSHDHVGARRQHEAGTQCRTVDRRNHRFAAVHKGKEYIAGQPIGAHVVALGASQCLLLLDVGAGAEHVALRGQHDGPYLRVTLQPIEDAQRCFADLEAQRIHRRPVQCHQGYARRRDRHLYVGFLHGVPRAVFAYPVVGRGSGNYSGVLNRFKKRSLSVPARCLVH